LRAKVSPFVIGLREIPPSGLHRDFDLSGDFARATFVDTEVDAESARVAASAELARTGTEVLVRGKIAGEASMVCSRCAGPAKVVLDGTFEVLFLPRDADAPKTDDGEAVDVSVYENDEIDLEETIREELLVALPYAPLCAEDCKGLCPTCGKDLNEGPCACPEPRDERLAALRDIKVD
jgi:DUF177 domain-containing protein